MNTQSQLVRKMFEAAAYARRPGVHPRCADDSEGWARYYAGEIIGGICEHCRLRNGAHAYKCKNHSGNRVAA